MACSNGKKNITSFANSHLFWDDFKFVLRRCYPMENRMMCCDSFANCLLSEQNPKRQVAESRLMKSLLKCFALRFSVYLTVLSCFNWCSQSVGWQITSGGCCVKGIQRHFSWPRRSMWNKLIHIAWPQFRRTASFNPISLLPNDKSYSIWLNFIRPKLMRN